MTNKEIHAIHVSGTEITFECEDGESILDAAQRAGYEIPYACRKGVCASCEGFLESGSINQKNLNRIVQGPADAALFCIACPTSNISIKPKTISKYDPSAIRTIEAKVYKNCKAGPDVAVLELRFPAGVRVAFKAGQYLKLHFGSGQYRAYSMANPTQSNDGVILHIRIVPSGQFSSNVLPGLVKGETVEVTLPYGDFYLREDSTKPVIFVATGTGFAPVKSIIESSLRTTNGDVRRSFHLYWGGQRTEDLYQIELPLRWAKDHSHILFTPVVSNPDSSWNGRHGFVHQAVLEDYPLLADYQVYACGNPMMVAAVRDEFVNRGMMPRDEIYCDAFV